MGTSRINDYTLDVYYRDQNALELKDVTDLLGKCRRQKMKSLWNSPIWSI